MSGCRRSLPCLASVIVLLVSGCSSAGPEPLISPFADSGLSAIRPGDLVALAVWREPDVTGEYSVDERGIAVFPLIGELVVSSIPADSLRPQLVVALSKYLRNPTIEVKVLRRISVLGEVLRPGVYSVDPTISVADALAMAGGVASTGNSGNIKLIRNQIEYRDQLTSQSLISSLPLRSGDQLVVAQRSWLSRNVPLVSSLLTATAVIVAATIR